MILVFKTTVKHKRAVKKLKPLLNKCLINCAWNFDLEDCDKILRVDTSTEISDLVITTLIKNGFSCEELHE